MTMHRHQAYNFRLQLLSQKNVSAYNIATVCYNGHVQENMLSSNRFTSIQSKTISRLSEFRVSLQILVCNFDTQKRLKKHCPGVICDLSGVPRNQNVVLYYERPLRNIMGNKT